MRVLYSVTRLTAVIQQTFLQASSHNIIICLTDMPPCKVEHNQMETSYLSTKVIILLGGYGKARRTTMSPTNLYSRNLHEVLLQGEVRCHCMSSALLL